MTSSPPSSLHRRRRNRRRPRGFPRIVRQGAENFGRYSNAVRRSECDVRLRTRMMLSKARSNPRRPEESGPRIHLLLGERTLVAVSLRSLSPPKPVVCLLDEVDAPLATPRGRYVRLLSEFRIRRSSIVTPTTLGTMQAADAVLRRHDAGARVSRSSGPGLGRWSPSNQLNAKECIAHGTVTVGRTVAPSARRTGPAMVSQGNPDSCSTAAPARAPAAEFGCRGSRSPSGATTFIRSLGELPMLVFACGMRGAHARIRW